MHQRIMKKQPMTMPQQTQSEMETTMPGQFPMYEGMNMQGGPATQPMQEMTMPQQVSPMMTQPTAPQMPQQLSPMPQLPGNMFYCPFMQGVPMPQQVSPMMEMPEEMPAQMQSAPNGTMERQFNPLPFLLYGLTGGYPFIPPYNYGYYHHPHYNHYNHFGYYPYHHNYYHKYPTEYYNHY